MGMFCVTLFFFLLAAVFADKNDELCILPSEDEGEEMLFEFFSQEPPPVYQLLVGQDAR